MMTLYNLEEKIYAVQYSCSVNLVASNLAISKSASIKTWSVMMALMYLHRTEGSRLSASFWSSCVTGIDETSGAASSFHTLRSWHNGFLYDHKQPKELLKLCNFITCSFPFGKCLIDSQPTALEILHTPIQSKQTWRYLILSVRSIIGVINGITG